MKTLKNKAQCKNCGDIIESKHKHDFVTCDCFVNDPHNQGIFIDGGQDYGRFGGNLDNFIDLSELEDE